MPPPNFEPVVSKSTVIEMNLFERLTDWRIGQESFADMPICTKDNESRWWTAHYCAINAGWTSYMWPCKEDICSMIQQNCRIGQESFADMHKRQWVQMVDCPLCNQFRVDFVHVTMQRRHLQYDPTELQNRPGKFCRYAQKTMSPDGGLPTVQSIQGGLRTCDHAKKTFTVWSNRTAE